jgi:hypothetical protein
MSSVKPSDGSIGDQRSLAAQHLRFAITDQREIIRGTDVKSEVLGIWPGRAMNVKSTVLKPPFPQG